MADFVQQLTDLWHRLAADPTSQTHALLAGILAALSTLALRRRRTAEHTRINVDAPPGQRIRIEAGQDDDSDA